MELIVKLLVASVTTLLLMSMGGQFYAAPILIPALWWAARSSKKWAAAGFTFLAALLMSEVGWVIAYVTVGEEQPWIALAPALGFVVTIALFIRSHLLARRKRS
jgi:hypothetical protein